MKKIFITSLNINEVRHLKNIDIPIAEDNDFRHFIITGKNGSGKTSLVDAISQELKAIYTSTISESDHGLKNPNASLDIQFSCSLKEICESYKSGHAIFAYYKADRIFKIDEPKQVEKIELQTAYPIDTPIRQNFEKYLLDMKVTQALAQSSGKGDKTQIIQVWFERFEGLLQMIFGNPQLALTFDEETFRFYIKEPGKEPYDFNALSSGYGAVLDIVVDIMMRMEKLTKRSFIYDLSGIVLIDEIETHLHLELQKNIMKMLTTIFPNIQFVVTTHSPFVLNSIDNATIFDLESRKLVKTGLSNVPYSGIVEGYFQTDELSEGLQTKFERYKKLVSSEKITDDDIDEITHLELYLDEIPDYLALGIATEYKRLKLEFETREDI